MNPLLYPNIGGILVYSNKKSTGLSKELRIPKVSIRASHFYASSTPYVKRLQEVYLLAENKRLGESEAKLSSADVAHYVNQCI